MEQPTALTALSALSHATRLDIFRTLVQAGTEGMVAGDLAQALALRLNTLSAQLSVLVRAGLIRNRREGRMIRYHAEVAQISALLGYLMEDCCGGRPELCRPALAALTQPCCQTETP